MSNANLSNIGVSRLLRHVAAVYLITKENTFKTTAYQKAADAVEQLDREIKDVWEEGKLDDIPGLGASIQSHLDELFTKGHSKHFDAIFKKVPEAVFELMKVPQIGPLTAYKLSKELHIKRAQSAHEELKKAAKEGKIAKIPTFGEKSQNEILESLEFHKKTSHVTSSGKRMPLPYADGIAQEIIAYLKKLAFVGRVEALGSLRRQVSTIGDIDIA